MDNIAAVEIPDQHEVMVAINVTVHNSGEKSLWIHDIKAKITTDAANSPMKPHPPWTSTATFRPFPR